MTVASPDDFVERPAGELGRWTVSLLLVAALHVAALVALLSWRSTVEPLESPPAAVMIDLAPLPTAAPAPQVVQPPPPPEPEPVIEPLPTPAPLPEVALPPPPPKPIPVPKRVEKPPPKPVPQPVPTVAAPPAAEPAPPAPVAAPAATPAPPAPSTNPSACFDSLVFAKLKQAQRYPRAAAVRGDQGTPTLRFMMDRTGKVLSFKLERGTGIRLLDEEALALVQRAELPPFPPEMTESQKEYVIPIIFKLN